jgi:hypothetical protein
VNAMILNVFIIGKILIVKERLIIMLKLKMALRKCAECVVLIVMELNEMMFFLREYEDE